MNWTTVLVIIIILVSLDKFITVLNIKAVERTTPSATPVDIERNPVAKWFFLKTGLILGSILYGIITVAASYFGIKLLGNALTYFVPANGDGVALYIFMMLYGLVIFNNLYFFIRYSKLL